MGRLKDLIKRFDDITDAQAKSLDEKILEDAKKFDRTLKSCRSDESDDYIHRILDNKYGTIDDILNERAK